ncbi:MAG: glutaredoxin domain-containing protein [Gammaproteobacteria bacterium]|nr:MAG: glutaredoxin domain-containing protein [Gammaproteobacteria bacterium]
MPGLLTVMLYPSVAAARLFCKRLTLVLCLMGFTTAYALAGVYKWVDEDGRVHFSDKAPTDIKAKTLDIQIYSGPAEVSGGEQGFGARSVTMLSTAWCSVCKKAKAYLKKRGISFLEYDIEKSTVGRMEYQKLNGKGVPIILVGNQRMNGFNPSKLDRMLANVGY